ncbi:MAG: multicopper oxidase domain-containing protein [Bacteroidetes bacterium]|nr:multicopper oxidase domain-containing protein [Bacteroidota bacterium]
MRSNAQKDTMCDGKVIPIFGITNSLGAAAKIPAKILYCNEGDSMVLNTKSISQGEHHTIHLHGLDVDTRNDGDPATSFWLSHMQDTTYSFKAKNAGTYLYHCHAADVIHVQMGMYGMIVVRAAGGAKTAWTGGPSFDKDYKWLMSEVDSVWHYHVPVHDTIADTVHVPKYVPNYFLINGKCGSEILNDDSIKIKGAQGEKILMRLANIGYLTNRIIFPSWLGARIIDSDGRPLPNAIVNDTCYIMPGERFSVMLQPTIQATANVAVEYLDMNTGNITLTNQVPVNINGVIGIKEEQLQEQLFSVYPNPGSDLITIKSSVQINSSLQCKVYNTLGQLVLEKNIRSGETIDVSLLPSGLYNIIIYSSEVKSQSCKLIKVAR